MCSRTVLLSVLLLFVAIEDTSASHFRGGTVSWTRSSSSSLTITARVVMHFYTGGIFPRRQDVRLNWGDGTRNSPSRSSSFLNGTWDATGTVRTIVYEETHTYAQLQLYKAYIYSNARQHAIINGPDRPYRVEAGVNLAEPQCLSSPSGIIPGVTYLQIRPDAEFDIAASTGNAQALSYSWYGNSYLNVNPPVAPSGAEPSLRPAQPSYNGINVDWNTMSGVPGSLYAVSIRSDIIGLDNCHAVWDATVQLEESVVPQCLSGGGTYTVYSSDSVLLTLKGSDGSGGRHNAAIVGSSLPTVNAPTFSALDDTEEVTMSWPSPTPGSYSFSVQFCSLAGLCGACSVSLNVNDALPRISVETVATVTENGQYTFETLVDNQSNNNQDVTVSTVTSSIDGNLEDFGCQTGVIISADGAYNCTYTSTAADPTKENVISVQVTANNGPIESVAGASSSASYPETTSSTSTQSTDVATSGGAVTGAPQGGTGGSSAVATTIVTPTTTPIPIVTFSPLLTPMSCGVLSGDTCLSSNDCGGPGDDQTGFCSSNGFCSCAIGYQGVGTNLDPTACQLVCSPPPVADTVAFLNEPILDSYAEAGDLIVRVSVDPNLRQKPASIAMINPTTGVRCGILPERLGFCELTQEVNPGNCWTEYMWRHSTFASVVAESGCFIELPNVTTSGPGFTLMSRQFRTIYEVDLVGAAPFGQDASRRRASEVTLRRTLRRQYTFTVDTELIVESNQFTVVADGLIQYRLVKIDTRPLSGTVVVRVQTRVVRGGQVSPARVNRTATIGLPNLVRDVQMTPCQYASADSLYCDQFHEITFSLDPCQADGVLVLNAGLQCDDPANVDDPVACGFINVPVGNHYTLDNLLVSYNSCPVTTSYGLDLSQSFLRIFTDATRTVPVSDPIQLGGRSFGRLSLRAGTDSSFELVTLRELHLYRKIAPNNQDLGDQLVGSSYMTMLSSLVSTDRINPVWDFEVLHNDVDFDDTSVYFWEATVDLIFVETGVLETRKVIFTDRNRADRSVQHLVAPRNPSPDTQNESIYSNVFRLETAVRADDPVPNSSSTTPIGYIVAGVVGGLAVVAAALVIVIIFKRHRKKQHLEAHDAPISK